MPEENSVLFHVKEKADRVVLIKDMPKGYMPDADVPYAFTISSTKLKDCVSKDYQNNTLLKQKRNHNIDDSVLKCKKKQKSTITVLEYFKQLHQKRHNESFLAMNNIQYTGMRTLPQYNNKRSRK